MNQEIVIREYGTLAPTACVAASVYIYGVLQPTFIYVRGWSCNTTAASPNSGHSLTMSAGGRTVYGMLAVVVLLLIGAL